MLYNILITLILLILLYYFFIWIYQCINKNETWANYVTPYYDYVKTGSDPLMYYAKPIYRKPYRYPFQFYKSYPYPHLSYYELL